MHGLYGINHIKENQQFLGLMISMKEVNKIYNMDCLEGLKQIDSDCTDSIVTDPPYQLSSITRRFGKEDSAPANYGNDGSFQRVSKGFMGKTWDVLPSIDVWKECLRVLKPGAFAFVMTTPRQDSLCQILNDLSSAGFVMGFSSIYWTYASGFPKASNVSKMVDKRLGFEREVVGKDKNSANRKGTTFHGAEYKGGYTTNVEGERYITNSSSQEAKSLDGSFAGFQPKPAVEIILVAMKPLSEKSYVDQALKNGKGVTWFDDARFPVNPEIDDMKRVVNRQPRQGGDWKENSGYKNETNIYTGVPENGRFPANLLVSDDILNDGKNWEHGGNVKGTEQSQTGVDTSCYGEYGRVPFKSYNDSGSFSRYFDLDKWFEKQISNLPTEVQKTFPFLICEKADKTERNIGCENLPEKIVECLEGNKDGTLNKRTHGEPSMSKNIHPTAKPIKLMMYLITLGSRKNDIILDPFIGSGTTAIASKLLGRQFIGFEIEKEYFDIANERLKSIPEYYEHEKETINKIKNKDKTVDKWLK
jgi:DNA modification methylase